MSIESTTYTIAIVFFFHWRTQRTFGITFKHCRLLVTITFCLIMFRLLFYNMHVYISWCYKRSFINISCQFVRLFFFFHSRFLLLRRLAFGYLQVLMCRYKKNSKKLGLLLTLSLFLNFIVTPSNTGLLCL